jgi:glucosamine--fructose-6-phosphate aminotransferase (isomerizing)
MCGIVGYIGHRNATPLLLEGLRCLEYRGYDSAGLAVLTEAGIAVRRSVGKLDNLAAVLAADPPVGTVGIGHTRWATHGRPSTENAHPHRDCTDTLVVVHNGIVENYLALRQELRTAGHLFRSETDTEVIVHLVEQAVREGASLVEAVRWTLQRLQGYHALVVLSAREPTALIAARRGHAGGVVVGYGQGEMFVASDLPALLSHTREVVFLEDGEIAIVERQGARYLALDGAPRPKRPQTVPWDPVSAAKGGYKHFMLKEIHEQPRALTDVLRGRLVLDPPGVALEDVPFTPAEIQALQRVVLVGCGTAWHASLCGKFFVETLARLPAEVDYASEFRYRDPLLGPETLLVAVTQSGETVDTLVSLEAGRRQGARTLAVVNVVGSQASRLAEGRLYLHAGPEIGVAATKTFTAQLVALYLLALFLGQARGVLPPATLAASLESLLALPGQVGQVLQDEEPYRRLADLYHKRRDFLYLGRGVTYPIALEGALKLKEISYIHAEGYPAGELKHGPIALVDEEMPVVVLAPRDGVYEKTLSAIEQVKARGGTVIAVGTAGDPLLPTKVDHLLPVPAAPGLLAPVVLAVPLQLLAYYIAVRRGCDVDQPRHLAKSVTVE